MVASSANGGSSGSPCPRRESASFTSRSVAPASTVAVRSPCACARTRFSRRMSSMTSMRAAGRPQSIFVPAPRMTIDRRSSDARFIAAATSAAVDG